MKRPWWACRCDTTVYPATAWGPFPSSPNYLVDHYYVTSHNVQRSLHIHIYIHVKNKLVDSVHLPTFISQIGAAGVHNDRGLPTSARCGCVTLEQAKPELHSNGRERADPPRVSTSYRNPADAWDAQIVKLFRVHQTVKSLCFPTSRKVIGLGRFDQVSCEL